MPSLPKLKKIVVVGAGGLAREMALLIQQINERQPSYDFLGYVASERDAVGKTLTLGKVIASDEDFLNSANDCSVVIGVGYPKVRAKIAESYCRQKDRFEFPNLIHSTACVDRSMVIMGKGNVITAGCIFTCDITIGDFNLFNLHTTVGHDAVIGNHCVINPSCNISGFVRIGNNVLCGTGSQKTLVTPAFLSAFRPVR